MSPYDRILDGVRAPKWNHHKQVRYVFWRMASGALVTDALRELCLDPQIFWNFVDKKQTTIFEKEFARAKVLQARAVADSVTIISEGRDAVSLGYMAGLEKRIRKVMRKYRKSRGTMLNAIIDLLRNDLGERERAILGRNRLQIDAAKWHAKTVDPIHYADRMDHSISTPDGETGKPLPIVVQFIDARGKAVDPVKLAKDREKVDS